MATEQRLIDANKVARDVRENNKENFFQADWSSKRVCELLESAPTVDAVEVVRCKDCEKWKCHGMPFDITKGTCYNPRFHFHHGHVLNECFMPVTNETDFCSYGERRTDHV